MFPRELKKARARARGGDEREERKGQAEGGGERERERDFGAVKLERGAVRTFELLREYYSYFIRRGRRERKISTAPCSGSERAFLPLRQTVSETPSASEKLGENGQFLPQKSYVYYVIPHVCALTLVERLMIYRWKYEYNPYPFVNPPPPTLTSPLNHNENVGSITLGNSSGFSAIEILIRVFFFNRMLLTYLAMISVIRIAIWKKGKSFPTRIGFQCLSVLFHSTLFFFLIFVTVLTNIKMCSYLVTRRILKRIIVIIVASSRQARKEETGTSRRTPRQEIVFVLFSGSLGTSVFDTDVYLVGASGGVYALLAAHLANVLLNYNNMEFGIVRLIGIFVIGKWIQLPRSSAACNHRGQPLSPPSRPARYPPAGLLSRAIAIDHWRRRCGAN